MRSCLLITWPISPTLGEEIRAGTYPRVEFFELARILDATVLDTRLACTSQSFIVRNVAKINPVLALGILAWHRRKEFDLFYAGSEGVALILAALLKLNSARPVIAVLNHWLSNPRKSRLFKLLRLGDALDLLICLNKYQVKFAEEILGVSSKKIAQLDYGANVDGEFFSPAQATPESGRYILSIGLEQRDYRVLFEAVKGTDVQVKVIASGIRPIEAYDISVPKVKNECGNIELIDRVPYPRLRDLYAGAEFFVLPIRDVEFPAGITAIMESFAMGKPVVATRSRGVSEYIEDGVTGYWVASGDSADLREKVLALWNDRAKCERMGESCRQTVKGKVDLSRYVGQLASLLKSLVRVRNA